MLQFNHELNISYSQYLDTCVAGETVIISCEVSFAVSNVLVDDTTELGVVVGSLCRVSSNNFRLIDLLHTKIIKNNHSIVTITNPTLDYQVYNAMSNKFLESYIYSEQQILLS